MLIGAEDIEEDIKNININNDNKPKKQNHQEISLSDFEDESLVLDSVTTSSSIKAHPVKEKEAQTEESQIVQSRKYDLSITYDKYYQTPRIWLYGYDENGSPLKPDRMLEDVMADYAQRTVTLEAHPHTSIPQASVHPCQHATAMKRIINALLEANKKPNVDQYLFIFLKFIQSVVPTIEYDYTMDVDVS